MIARAARECIHPTCLAERTLHMNSPLAFAAAAAFAFGAWTLSPTPAAAMPVADVSQQMTPAVDPVHAVRVCSRGRCWWTTAGHFHGRYGWGRPYRNYGWRHPGWRGHRYGYGGWRRGHRHW
ncbi:MAG: hypothetical protein CTY15_11300 [Methylocystis sp.]|nr:MAG: hypothetical protein CTY15_11300 [Methylocystis sp.]